jgi:hypothetical protein
VFVARPPDPDAVLDHLLRTLAGGAEDQPSTTPTTGPVVGEATLSFDGAACVYEGPTTLPVGSLRVTVKPGSAQYLVLVAHLVDGATPDEALAWQAEHPGEQPPMVDAVEVVGEGFLPSPANVALHAGLNPVLCALPDGSVVPGAVVDVVAGM